MYPLHLVGAADWLAGYWTLGIRYTHIVLHCTALHCLAQGYLGTCFPSSTLYIYVPLRLRGQLIGWMAGCWTLESRYTHIAVQCSAARRSAAQDRAVPGERFALQGCTLVFFLGTNYLELLFHFCSVVGTPI